MMECRNACGSAYFCTSKRRRSAPYNHAISEIADYFLNEAAGFSFSSVSSSAHRIRCARGIADTKMSLVLLRFFRQKYLVHLSFIIYHLSIFDQYLSFSIDQSLMINDKWWMLNVIQIIFSKIERKKFPCCVRPKSENSARNARRPRLR